MTEAKRASGFWIIGSGGSESRGEKVSCTYSEGREGGEETIYGGKALESKQSISSTPKGGRVGGKNGRGGGAHGMSMILRWIVDRWTDGGTDRQKGKSHPA